MGSEIGKQRLQYACRYNSPDNNDDGSGRDAEHQNEEPSSSEIRTSAAPFATSASIALPLADNTSEDDQKPAAKEYASSGGMTTTTTTTTPPSPSPAPIQVTSKKRRENHEHEGRFSFREPFLEKVSCNVYSMLKACHTVCLTFYLSCDCS